MPLCRFRGERISHLGLTETSNSPDHFGGGGGDSASLSSLSLSFSAWLSTFFSRGTRDGVGRGDAGSEGHLWVMTGSQGLRQSGGSPTNTRHSLPGAVLQPLASVFASLAGRGSVRVCVCGRGLQGAVSLGALSPQSWVWLCSSQPVLLVFAFSTSITHISNIHRNTEIIMNSHHLASTNVNILPCFINTDPGHRFPLPASVLGGISLFLFFLFLILTRGYVYGF